MDQSVTIHQYDALSTNDSREYERYDSPLGAPKPKARPTANDGVRFRHCLSVLIDTIDQRLNQQINAILHHPRFQAMEALWRGVALLTATRADYDERVQVRIKILHCTWSELAKDVIRAIEFDQSQLFQRLYSDEFDMPGGEPFGALVCDYRVSHRRHTGCTASDVQVLREVSAVAAAALCPCLFAADASLLGLSHFAELRPTFDPEALFQQSEYTAWRSLRKLEDTRFLGIFLPDVLLREPYIADGLHAEPPGFTEDLKRTEDVLWGNAAFTFASVLIRAFANTGWFADIRGGRHEFGEGGVVRGLCASENRLSVTTGKRIAAVSDRPSVSTVIDDTMERALNACGLIPLCGDALTGQHFFFSNASLHEPQAYESEAATINAHLSAMLQYILCASRFGHYIKVIGREKIGSTTSTEDCRRLFQEWLNQYTTASSGASEVLKAKYPLGESKVQISEVPGRLALFNCVIYLKPHYQLDQLASSIQLVTQLAIGSTDGK